MIKDRYEIGWMTASAFSNTLLYDGREKQTLADGIYKFRCGYQDDENGEVKSVRDGSLSRVYI